MGAFAPSYGLSWFHRELTRHILDREDSHPELLANHLNQIQGHVSTGSKTSADYKMLSTLQTLLGHQTIIFHRTLTSIMAPKHLKDVLKDDLGNIYPLHLGSNSSSASSQGRRVLFLNFRENPAGATSQPSEQAQGQQAHEHHPEATDQQRSDAPSRIPRLRISPPSSLENHPQGHPSFLHPSLLYSYVTHPPADHPSAPASAEVQTSSRPGPISHATGPSAPIPQPSRIPVPTRPPPPPQQPSRVPIPTNPATSDPRHTAPQRPGREGR